MFNLMKIDSFWFITLTVLCIYVNSIFYIFLWLNSLTKQQAPGIIPLFLSLSDFFSL